MKDKEEVTLVKLQLVSLLSLVVLTVAIQYADYEINKFNSGVLDATLYVSNKLQIGTQLTIHGASTFFKQWIPFEKMTNEDKEQWINSHLSYVDSLVLKDPAIDELLKRLKNDKDLKRFYGDLTKILDNKVGSIANEYNTAIFKLNDVINKGTIWVRIKPWLLTFQLLAIVILAYGYSKLMRDISNRIAQKEEKGNKK
jgi:hypothetical protein